MAVSSPWVANDDCGNLANSLQVLYEFDKADDLGANSSTSGKSARQTGPAGAVVTQDTKAPCIGAGAGDFTQNDATLKVHASDMQRVMREPAGDLTIAYWFKATSRAANHTVWAMSNEPIPSPQYSNNRAKAILATHTIEVATPEEVILGLVRPGSLETARTEAPLTDGKWHHLAVTVDQDSAGGKVTGRLFIDGKPGNQAVIGGQPQRHGNRTVSIEELECYVYVRK